MIIDSNDLAGHSAYDLLKAAAAGTVGIDRRWLHALVDEPAKTLPDLVRFAAEDRSEDRIPLQQDLISIFQHLKTPLALPFLLDEIRAEPSDITDELVEVLVSIGQPAIDPLLKLYDELGPEEGGEVAFLLAGMAIRDPRILELLLGRLNLDLSDALFQIEVYRDPAAIPALEKRLETTQDEEARLDLSDTIADLRESQPEAELTEFDIWDLYPDEADPDYEVLSEEERLEFLSSPNASQRADAATSFFGAEYSIHARAKLLELARQDPDPEVRACCWEAFFDQTEDTELLRLMLARLNNPDTPKRERAGLILGLARHTDQDEVREAILELAEDPDTRERAVETMWRSFDASFGPEAAKYIDDPDMEVRRNAIWAIGYLQVAAGAKLLPNFFDDEELRADALHNYALVAPGAVKGLFKKIESVAKGLTAGEAEAVKAGIDVRLVRAGKKAIYTRDEDDEPVVAATKVGRNDPCPCGSGKKYKKCCGQ